MPLRVPVSASLLSPTTYLAQHMQGQHATGALSCVQRQSRQTRLHLRESSEFILTLVECTHMIAV